MVNEEYFNEDGVFMFREYRSATGYGGYPRIRAAFKDLRSHGYFSRMNFWCCQTCGWDAVPKGKHEKVVFFHSQDDHNLRSEKECFLSWAGDGDFIVEILSKYGLEPVWDGTGAKRIKINIRNSPNQKD
tara:strand:- start:29695 stop:30081 length:387 start_codon:yes stop_codon:yes gene_type:complete